MFLLDRLLIGGLRFVFDKIAQVADSELENADQLKEELLAAQMSLELGEIDEQQFSEVEQRVLARLRELREQEQGTAAPALREEGVSFEVEVETDLGHEEGPGSRR